MPAPTLALLTDFGPDSLYVAQLKGRLFSGLPDVRLIDLSHAIRPQDVASAARFLLDCVDWYPAETLFLAVVDPGVGTERRLLYARSAGRRFLAPDNGLLAPLFQRRPPDDLRTLDPLRTADGPVSPTFHGRDLLAPAAVKILTGRPLDDFMQPTSAWVELAERAATVRPGRIEGCVLEIDAFGNLISNVDREAFARAATGGDCRVRCGGAEAIGVTDVYGRSPPGSVVALFGSTGRLEMAVVDGSAAERLRVERGAALEVVWQGAGAGG